MTIAVKIKLEHQQIMIFLRNQINSKSRDHFMVELIIVLKRKIRFGWASEFLVRI